jgi:NADPH:quinone reductase-like Zn-dependent oxidoreductase
MAQTMRAIRFHEYGVSRKLILETVERSEPKTGQVLVKVRYAGVNPLDWKLRSGLYKDFMPVAFPSTPGKDFSGTVEALGSGVSGFSVGQRVFGSADGAYADFVVAKVESIAAIPDNLTFEQAASVPLGALTAWHVVEDAGIADGQTVIVVGAAGGVGMFAVQFARLKGAFVTGLASGKNVGFVNTLGAEGVDYASGAISNLVGKADVVIDTVGGAALENAFSFVKKGGTLLTVAGMASAQKAAELGISARSSGNRGSQPLAQIARLLASGKVVTEIGPIFDLADAGAAQDLSQTGHGRGRILLKI